MPNMGRKTYLSGNLLDYGNQDVSFHQIALKGYQL